MLITKFAMASYAMTMTTTTTPTYYRHDLESILYPLLWICARSSWEKESQCLYHDQPRESVQTKWYSGSFKKIARSKLSNMHVDGFEDILDKFPPSFDCVKPLCRKIRSILFPLLEDGALFTGTTSDPPEQLYDPIIEAFDNAVADIAARQKSDDDDDDDNDEDDD